MIDFNVAVDKLAGFQTSNEIAEFLKAEQIQGIPRHDMSCPIATWVREQTGLQGISVTETEVAEYDRKKWVQLQRVEMSDAMADFVNRFDEDEFPELAWGEE